MSLSQSTLGERYRVKIITCCNLDTRRRGFFYQILFTEEPPSGQTLIYIGRAQPLSSVIITDINNILFSPS